MERLKKLPQNFKMETLSQSVHYPQYEESDLFDERIIKWHQSL
jgi:hypothetical protein